MTKATDHMNAWERAQIARAVSYAAYLFNGRGDKYHVPCASLADARRAAADLDATTATNARRAMVYAVTPEGWSIHVSEANSPA